MNRFIPTFRGLKALEAYSSVQTWALKLNFSPRRLRVLQDIPLDCLPEPSVSRCPLRFFSDVFTVSGLDQNLSVSDSVQSEVIPVLRDHRTYFDELRCLRAHLDAGKLLADGRYALDRETAVVMYVSAVRVNRILRANHKFQESLKSTVMKVPRGQYVWVSTADVFDQERLANRKGSHAESVLCGYEEPRGIKSNPSDQFLLELNSASDSTTMSLVHAAWVSHIDAQLKRERL